MAARNLKNATIALLVPLPSIVFFLFFIHHHHAHSDAAAANSVFSWCYNHPFLLANLLFFFNVNVLFWIIGLIQSNNWMIDLYWTVIPVMLVHYYASHPMTVKDGLRSAVVIALTWVWSVRLTHNYFRREKWQWGEREDWRFNEMRTPYGKHWWWVSFFAVYFSQQIFLIGICLPMYAIHTSDKPWDRWDFFATVACIIGIVIAYYADTQLHDFVQRNERLKKLGAPTVPNLEKGLWRYSRHPNYFGEQLWWWALAGFAWNLGQRWMFIGTFINTLCLAYVTVLVEKRMLKQQHRTEAYMRYQKSTSVWIPWFSSAIKDSKAKTS